MTSTSLETAAAAADALDVGAFLATASQTAERTLIGEYAARVGAAQDLADVFARLPYNETCTRKRWAAR